MLLIIKVVCEAKIMLDQNLLFYIDMTNEYHCINLNICLNFFYNIKMKITLKTLKGEIIHLDLEPESTVVLYICRLLILKIKFNNKKEFKFVLKKLFLKENLPLILTQLVP